MNAPCNAESQLNAPRCQSIRQLTKDTNGQTLWQRGARLDGHLVGIAASSLQRCRVAHAAHLSVGIFSNDLFTSYELVWSLLRLRV
jgi:hypothetical protein